MPNENSNSTFCWPDEVDEDFFWPSIEIYDLADVHRLLKAENADTPFSISENALSHEEDLWLKQLGALIKHPDSNRRSILIADESMIQRIGGLKQVAPHFESVIDIVLRAAKLSLKTKSPLLLPPLLLLGEAGLGKTFFARRLAEAIKTHLEYVSVDLLSDHGSITGLSLSWKAARPGRIAKALLASTCASPIIVLDEVDKANPLHPFEQHLGFLHTALEPESARNFSDEYLTVPMRAESIIWILTANSVEGLSPSILSRLMIMQISEPTRAQRELVVKVIYERVNARYNQAFSDTLNDEVIERLIHTNPRQARKTLEIALAFANDGGREHLLTSDVESAWHLLNVNDAMAGSVGFV